MDDRGHAFGMGVFFYIIAATSALDSVVIGDDFPIGPSKIEDLLSYAITSDVLVGLVGPAHGEELGFAIFERHALSVISDGKDVVFQGEVDFRSACIDGVLIELADDGLAPIGVLALCGLPEVEDWEFNCLFHTSNQAVRMFG